MKMKTDRVVNGSPAFAQPCQDCRELIREGQVALTFGFCDISGKFKGLAAVHVSCIREHMRDAPLDEHDETMIELTAAAFLELAEAS